MPANIEEMISKLHEASSAAIKKALSDEREKLAESYSFASDLDHWTVILKVRRENKLLQRAGVEFMSSMLNLCQAQYSNSFKSLRLVLELSMQALYLSTVELDLREWLAGEQDTNWTNLKGENGPLSDRHCRVFLPNVRSHSKSIHAMAASLYRELSELVHGNESCSIPIKEELAFDGNVNAIWFEKAKTVRLIVLFGLCVRYLDDLCEEEKAKIEPGVTEVLNHIEAIRVRFGGPSS